MKQRLIKILLLSLLLTSTIAASSDYESNGFEEDMLGDITLEELQNFEHTIDVTSMALKTPLPPALLAIGLKSIKEPLWNNTKAPAGRDILYLLPYKITAVEYGGISVKMYFNMTDRLHVTANDLLNVAGNQDLIENFGLIPGSLSTQEVNQLLPLFMKMTFQERKTGFLIQSAFLKGPFTIQLHSSIGLAERNFWLNNRDADTIKAVFAAKFKGGGDFNEKEFYKIRIGMGDTRLKVGLNTINMTSFQTDVGFEAIIPTSRLSYTPKVKIGLAQTHFDDDKLATSALNTLRGVRDYLINPRLGNNGHFGLGCYLESKVGIFHEAAQLWMRCSYDVLFPGTEDRLFLFKKTLSPNDLSLRSSEATINDYVRQYVFPSSFKANVVPGGILNIVTAASMDLSKKWRWAFGYDFYAQQDELINQLYNTNVDLQSLRVEDAQSSSVVQHKVFTEIMWHKKTKNKDFGLGLGGDVTLASKGIGEDWTVYFKIASSF